MQTPDVIKTQHVIQTQNVTQKSTSDHTTGLVLFISDVHLCESRPQITAAFLQFLSQTASQAQALYVLGDLFEYWAGDDDIDDPFHQTIIQAFANLAKNGVALFLMHGNRDFLMAEQFCEATNMTLLADPSCIQMFAQSILLSHGDALCTDDEAYQQMRVEFRDAAWQKIFLNQSLANRKAQIASIRKQSAEAKVQKSMAIMDVNAEAVAALLRSFNYPAILIHGHTHRPDRHSHNVDGHQITRWVLGDWYEQGSYLALDASGCRAMAL